MKKHYERLIEPYLKSLMREFPAIAVDGLNENVLLNCVADIFETGNYFVVCNG